LTSYGSEVYKKLTKEASYFKQFFTNLKLATTGNETCLEKIFITGVSPVTMDDVTSGFNIGKNISIEKKYNGILGFSEEEVVTMLDYYFPTDTETFTKAEALDVMRIWYNNYIFSFETNEKMYNTDAVLYFITKSLDDQKIPRILVDDNLRMDYNRLRQLILESKKLNGNFAKLSEIINTGGVVSDIKTSFPFDTITEEENFISLLYYFGLISFSGKMIADTPYLVIPNETIKTIIFGYIVATLKDGLNFYVKLSQITPLMQEMAYNGDFNTAFNFVAEKIKELTSIDDSRSGEIVPKIFYLIYFSLENLFVIKTEYELNKGKADMVMLPNPKIPEINYAYLIEFKYINKSVSENALPTTLENTIAKAKAQLEQYSQDDNFKKLHNLKPHGKVELKKLIIVFHGWELVHLSEIV
jgi:hypothetical protein